MNEPRLTSYMKIQNAAMNEIEAIAERRAIWEKTEGLSTSEFDKVKIRRKFNHEMLAVIEAIPYANEADHGAHLEMFDWLQVYGMSLAYTYNLRKHDKDDPKRGSYTLNSHGEYISY